jgi:hypothetical protein
MSSPRKWKQKLKEWGFEKYVGASNRQFVLEKLISRQKREGKDTLFFHGGTQIPANKIEAFRRRRNSDLGASSVCGNLLLDRQNQC